MDNKFSKVLSHDCGGLMQFIKYGVVGVMSTLVQVVAFYLLAATWLQCLATDDLAVRFLHLPAVEVSDGVRALRAAVATAIGFTLANVFCWLMNRAFVFRAGKYKWYTEFFMFFGAAAAATLIALGLQSVFIKYFGMMTTLAVVIEVVASFCINFVVRKFYIFKG